jgi:hypothetical protein
LASVRGQPRIVGLPGGGVVVLPVIMASGAAIGTHVGCFNDDIYQLLDAQIGGLFVPQELSARTQTAGTESVRNVKTRRNWRDQLRILTWVIVDPGGIRWWMRNIGTAPLRTRDASRSHITLATSRYGDHRHGLLGKIWSRSPKAPHV